MTKPSPTNTMLAIKLGHIAQNSSRHKSLAVIFAFFGSLISTAAFAEVIRYPDFQEPFDFTLSFSKSDIDLQADTQKYSASFDRTSILMRSLIEPHLQMGFIAGSSNLSIDNDPTTAGINLSGYHAGITMRSTFGSNPKIGFRAKYVYQETKNETSIQTATLSWHEWSAGVFGKVILGQQLELSAGWAHHEIDAQRRVTGNINDTARMKLTSSSQGQFGMAWLVRSGGRVGLAVQRGSYQQVELTFSQTFR